MDDSASEPFAFNDSASTTTAVIVDTALLARRKRREIRRFKNLSLPVSAKRGIHKQRSRPLLSFGSGCNSIFSKVDGSESIEKVHADGTPQLAVKVAKVVHPELGNVLVRSQSFPPEGRYRGKCLFHVSKLAYMRRQVQISVAVRVRGDYCGDKEDEGDGTDGRHKELMGHLGNAAEIVDDPQVNSKDEQSTHVDSIGHIESGGGEDATSSRVIDAVCMSCPPSAKVLICGRRREMEDMAIIVPSFARVACQLVGSCACRNKEENRDLHFFAVYDGHGGYQASRYCAERLHHALAEELSPSPPICVSTGATTIDWVKLMAACFLKMDKEVGGVCPYGKCDDVNTPGTCCMTTRAPANVGTTAAVVLLNSCHMIVANCGDSRVVLSRGGKAIPLSNDHKPGRNDEICRIEASGGCVINWDGYRVGGLLALSRAIGDRYLKEYVISEPEVTCLQRTAEDECLIIASDGLWDVISNDTACEIARKYLVLGSRKADREPDPLGEDPVCSSLAALLAKIAYGRGSKDNISVVVVDLKAQS